MQACNFIRKETVAQVFSREFSQFSKNTFSTEHLQATASVLRKLEQRLNITKEGNIQAKRQPLFQAISKKEKSI